MAKCIIEWCNWVWCKNWKWWRSFPLWYCSKHYNRFKRKWSPADDLCKYIPTWKTKNALYTTYRWIKQRCYDKNCNRYIHYWWKWVKICERRLWPLGFESFIKDMWDKPGSEYTIERINIDGDYCPSNCIWATVHEQAANRSNNNKDVWVSWRKDRWKRTSAITVDNKVIKLWCYSSYEKALEARKEWEKRYLNK